MERVATRRARRAVERSARLDHRRATDVEIFERRVVLERAAMPRELRPIPLLDREARIEYRIDVRLSDRDAVDQMAPILLHCPERRASAIGYAGGDDQRVALVDPPGCPAESCWFST